MATSGISTWLRRIRSIRSGLAIPRKQSKSMGPEPGRRATIGSANSQTLGTAPMGKVQEHVGAQQEEQLAGGVLVVEVREGVNRIANAAAIGFIAAHRECRVSSDGQLQHLDPLGGRGEFPLLFVRRHGGRQKPNRVESTLLPAAFRQEQMAEVDRVKGAAEDAETQDSR